MLTRLRRSAGLLLVLFAGHLSMVTGGAVCVVPGMQAMGDAVRSGGSGHIASMPKMVMDESATPGDDQAARASDAESSHQAPCSGPASATCVASMPCITAFGADPVASIALPRADKALVQQLAVLMPASSGSAPDLPPPRA